MNKICCAVNISILSIKLFYYFILLILLFLWKMQCHFLNKTLVCIFSLFLVFYNANLYCKLNYIVMLFHNKIVLIYKIKVRFYIHQKYKNAKLIWLTSNSKIIFNFAEGNVRPAGYIWFTKETFCRGVIFSLERTTY